MIMDIVESGKCKTALSVHLDGIFVINIVERPAVHLAGISVCHIAFAAAQKEQAVRSRLAGVAVRQIRQIVPAVLHRDNVPHVVCVTAPPHLSDGHPHFREAAFKIGQLAQILKCLGISLAHDICTVVPVEDPDQLPGVAVGCV